MEHLAPVGETYQAGTLSGNPLATAAGLATLAELDRGAYARLHAITTQLADGLAASGVQVPSAPGLLTVFFSARPVVDYETARAADHEAFARYWNAMLARGIYLPPSPYEAWFPSLAHTDRDIERTIEAAGESLEIAAHA
jgi:glutamate-1-semialdehyde 2,1-aminomutase